MASYLRGEGEVVGGEAPYGRYLATDSKGNLLQENPPTRVGEIGVGTFVIICLIIIYIGICCFGSIVKKPGFLYCMSTFTSAVIVVFLFEAQRTDRFIQEEETIDETDQYFNVRLFLLILLITTSCLTCCGWVSWILSPSVNPQGTESHIEST
eukprot:CAMPEP_0118666390 /NCGR_PEP_ID=MMETSP0785-20121206/19184_1 /TAXON_ID=91992 /ORGANISM="Bolidomonas pacifica, Strain CCMP 1866" /LENGTH=152 /DNA_ID=CAMNT_0006560687 /DNA_START=232 /DNA_END=686 /DNA_ORIENTATION=+